LDKLTLGTLNMGVASVNMANHLYVRSNHIDKVG